MSSKAAAKTSQTVADDSEFIEDARPSARVCSSSSESSDRDQSLTRVSEDDSHTTHFPNRWARWRAHLREPAAEFLGTLILISLGTGVDCQVTLSTNTAVAASPKGDYLSISFGWAAGTALGVWFAGGISGGHLNPAVTLALAVFRGFPRRKVPVYILAQVLGAFTGAAIVYANYYHAINLYEGGTGVRTVTGPSATAGLFSTYAATYMTNVSCFFSEFFATSLLLLVVLAITDRENGPPPPGLNPLVLFVTVLGIGVSLGMETGYAINPARDLGPRLLTAAAGYGAGVFNYRNQYWLWCPVLGPCCGALAGTFVYDAFIFQGDESILNKPDAAARRRHLHAPHEQREKGVAGADSV